MGNNFSKIKLKKVILSFNAFKSYQSINLKSSLVQNTAIMIVVHFALEG